MKRTISKTMSVVRFASITMIAAVLVSGTYVLNSFEPVITPYLYGYGAKDSGESYQEVAAKGQALAEQVESKGAVLLKNDNNVLPLANNKVNIFGWGGCDNGYLYMGGGSGGGTTYGRTSLYTAFRNNGIEINEELANAYNNLGYRRAGSYSVDNSIMYRLYEPDQAFYNTYMNNAKAFSDTAIIVITRYGQEGTDWPKCQYDAGGNKVNNGRTFAELTESEELLIQNVTDNFNKVIVLLNTCNAMECGFLDNDKINSALYMGVGGSFGSIGVAKLLTGAVTPSGKLADTYAYDMTTAPTFVNAGDNGNNYYVGPMSWAYIDYTESIYVGYRWYETADKDGFWDSAYAKNMWHIENGYEDVVQYPFGYGLSYATFDWGINSVNLSAGSTITDKDASIEINVVVTNTSDMFSGSDVVELYYEAPYYVGGIEKSSICLGAFAKTSVLEPGKSEQLTLTLPIRRMASYDCYDRNNNGFMGYELEHGEYVISLRSDVHTKKLGNNGFPLSLTYNVPQVGFKYETDEVTGTKIENRFTTYTNATTGASSTIYEPQAAKAYSIDGLDEANQGINYVTRSNFYGTFPLLKTPQRNSTSIYDSFQVHAPFNNPDDVMPVVGSTATHWKLSDMGGVDYDDPKWDELVSELTLYDLCLISARGGYTAVGVDYIGKPQGIVVDGPSGLNSGIMSPSGIRAITYPCQTIIACTWDWKEAYKVGKAIGEEAAAIGVTQWYGPGLNTHRSPFGGRNFEYFSEDPILAGELCAKEIQGAKEEGLSAYVKHFAANDSDTGRNGEYRWLTEQAMREIYLKPYEISVKKGGCNAMMTSVDRVGSTRAAGSYAMNTLVLRNEWGFKGSLVTDYYQGGNVHDADENIRAGNDMQLDPNGKVEYFDDRSSATAIIALQRSAKNQLYTYVDCLHTKATATGEDMSSLIVDVTPPSPTWLYIVIGVDALLGAGLITWAAFTVLRTKWKKEDDAISA